VLGPFYMEGAPERAAGADLGGAEGARLRVSGRVLDTAGRPLAGALLDVWQTAANGLYHMQDEAAPAFELCGRLRTDLDGRFGFTSRQPVSYSIPTDGPVGKLVLRVGRHPYRPAHIHFIVSAPGHRTVVTELFTDGDPYLDSDVVFGVKESLVVQLEEDGVDPDGSPRYRLEHDFVLEQADALTRRLPHARPDETQPVLGGEGSSPAAPRGTAR
jgi:catechol 1,2-dioxygenase